MRYKLLALACIFSANAMQLDSLRIGGQRPAADPCEHFLKKMTQLDSNPGATAWNVQTQNYKNIRIYTAETTRIILNFLVSAILKERRDSSENLYIFWVEKYLKRLVTSHIWLNDDETQSGMVSIGNMPQVYINYDRYVPPTASTLTPKQDDRLDKLFELLQIYEQEMNTRSLQYGSIIAIHASSTIDS